MSFNRGLLCSVWKFILFCFVFFDGFASFSLQGLKFTKRAMDGAAAAGHLEMVMWLHGEKAECSRDAMDFAAREGHLEVVQVTFSRYDMV